MSEEKTPDTNQDSAWKYILDCYFKEFMEFFFIESAKKIDWTKKYEMLDKELQTITTDEMTGKIFVDKLIKVKTLKRKEQILLIHVEVQSERQVKFPERLFEYYCKLYLAHKQPILTLAILTDSNNKWRPERFEMEALDFPALNFNFQINKLIDYRTQEQVLRESENPFALVVLVHLAFLKTKNKLHVRGQMKFNLVRALFNKGYDRDDVLNLFRVIDWVLVLPEYLEIQYKSEVHQLEEETKMNYLSSFEQSARDEGRDIGRQEGREEGMHRGRKIERYETAKKLLAKGMPRKFVSEITEISDLDLAEIQIA